MFRQGPPVPFSATLAPAAELRQRPVDGLGGGDGVVRQGRAGELLGLASGNCSPLRRKEGLRKLSVRRWARAVRESR